jgi:hypothetical protein
MFKKKCPKCGERINKNFEFCPICGNNQKSRYDKEDFGLIGKNDIIEESMFSSGGSFMEKMFETAFKVLEKQMKNLPNDFIENRKIISSDFPGKVHVQFFVNGKRVFPQIREEKNMQTRPKKPRINISEDKIKKMSKLPRIEPESNLKRVGRRVFYEIAVPGIEDINDIIINKLENSLEIKAIAKDKIYSKTLNVSLPVAGCRLINGNLILELVGN